MIDYHDPEALEAWHQHLATIELGESLGAESLEAEEDEGAEAEEEPAAERQQGKDPLWHTFDSRAIFLDTIDDAPLLIPRLDIGLGRPSGIVGGPGAGKSDTVQSLGLSIAAGLPVFGRFPATDRGPVLHLTYDMGYRATAMRYRRLANGMGISWKELQGNLELCVHPKVVLSTGNAEKVRNAFAEKMRGFKLCILDNLRDATPGVDENDSQFGQYVTLFGQAAALVDCVALYLHHTGNDPAAARGRGSSAIPAASGSIWVLKGTGIAPRQLTHARQHDLSDGPQADLWLVRGKPVEGPYVVGDRKSWALEARDVQPKSFGAAPEASAEPEILKALIEAPGASGADLIERLQPGLSAKSVRRALKALEDSGNIENRGDRSGGHFYIISESGL